jgi:WD40 repeat protein
MQFIQGEPLDRVLHDLRQLRQRAGGPAVGDSARTVAHSLLSGNFTAADQPRADGSPDPSADAPVEPRSSALSAGDSQGGYYRSVARVALQVAEALAYAHRQGILHRDIKPSNLLLDLQGTVWITDFGLAKAEGSDELTHTGDLVGTLRFMAPERFEGHSLPQSDLYALGLTLYELLTLRPAFADSNKARLIEKVLHETLPPPRKLDASVPRDLETMVLKCLARDPAERYATAAALAEDLQRFLADRPIRARRTPWHERAWRWCRRNPGWAAMFAVSLTLLTAMAIGGAVLSLHLSAALARSRRAEHERKKQVFEALVSEAKAQRLSGRAGQRFAALESIRKAAAMARELDMPESTFEELRDLAIAALVRPDIRLVKEWQGWPEGSHGVAFDARLEHYARGDKRGNITVRRLADDVEIARRVGVGSAVASHGFDEDGRGLVLVDSARKTTKRWRFDATSSAALEKLPAAFFAEDVWPAVTADRKLLVTLNHKSGLVRVHDMASGRHLRDIPFGKWGKGAGAAPESPTWAMHPWRHELAIALGGHTDPDRAVVRILDLDRGTVQAELVAGPRVLTTMDGGIAWHPDGRTLAVAYTHRVLQWDVPTRTCFHTITEHKGGGLAVSVSRSGQLMSTYAHWTGGIKVWHPHTRKLLLSVPSVDIHPSGQTPDGRMFTYRHPGTRLQLWATEPSPVLRLLVRGPSRGPLGEYRRSSVHPAGRLLAVGSTHGVSLFDLASGLDVGHLDLGYNYTAQFDPATGDLLTLGTAGLLRWPVRTEAGSRPRLRIGPPRRLLAGPAYDNEFRISRDGRTIVVARYSRVVVLHADRPDRPVVLQPTVDVRQQISISPDGRWIATGSHGGGDVLVWEARTGRLVKRKRFVNAFCLAQFTPDGKKLLVGTRELCRFWTVGDWKEQEPTISKSTFDQSMPTFSPDGRLLVWESGEGALRLWDTTAGRDLARLESPDQGRCGYTTLSPDGRLLITRNLDYQIIHVWDLHELRRQLRDMDLDWDAPFSAAPAQPGADRIPLPLEVEVDPGSLKGTAAPRGQ